MKNVVVTGANRGIGLQFVTQLGESNYNITACCRRPNAAHDLNTIASHHKNITVMPLDVTKDGSITALYKALSDKPIDILINNAGITGESGVTVGNIHKTNFMDVFVTNCYGVLKTSEVLLPLLEKSEDKLIVVISSSMGSITENERGGSYAYRASKSALNSVMRSFAIDVKPRDVKVLLLHPGWVKTNLGGKDALIDVKESVDGMLDQIEKHGRRAEADCVWRYDGTLVAW